MAPCRRYHGPPRTVLGLGVVDQEMVSVHGAAMAARGFGACSSTPVSWGTAENGGGAAIGGAGVARVR